MATDYTSMEMRRRIASCLSHIGLLLKHNKSQPSFAIDNAHEISHQYSDKYLLAEYLVNTSIAQVLNDAMLWTRFKEHLPTILSWSCDSSVSLRFHCKHTCVFVKEIEREVEDVTKHETEWKGSSSLFGSIYSSKVTSKVIKTVREFIYKFQVSYQLIAFRGVGEDPSQCLVVESHDAEQEIIATTKAFPYPEHKIFQFDVDVSWLLRSLHPRTAHAHTHDNVYEPQFHIDRSLPDCWTPCHNADTKKAGRFFTDLLTWTTQVKTHLLQSLFPVQRHNKNARPNFEGISIDGLIQPVLPLLYRKSYTTASSGSISAPSSSKEGLIHYRALAQQDNGALLPASLVNRMLAEHHRALSARCDAMRTLYPSGPAIVSAEGAILLLVLKDLAEVLMNVSGGIVYIEQMIRTQLVAAIGKEVTAADFAKYMDFHNRKLFKAHRQPRPFSFAVRRSVHHSPEGLVRIESAGDPITTISSCSIPADEVDPADIAQTYMHLALNASTNIRFGGDRHIHGWLGHRFSLEPLPELKLVAQARHFCCYIVLIGRMVSVQEFQPKYGFIAQSKDEFSIPLGLEPIPTAKEFKDAIESLSPEQRSFAKAFRSMQLESTLFAVCIIQIKPQLETVLNLSPDSLTKEIKLTQDLIQLFTKYQISSDLLSYDESIDGPSSPADSCNSRLMSVKTHVKAIVDMLEETKKEQLKARQLEAKYNVHVSDELAPSAGRYEDDKYSYHDDEEDRHIDDEEEDRHIDSDCEVDSTCFLEVMDMVQEQSSVFKRQAAAPIKTGMRSLTAASVTKRDFRSPIHTMRIRGDYRDSSSAPTSNSGIPPTDGHIAGQVESTAAAVPAVVSSDVYGIPDIQPSPSHCPLIDYTKYPSKLDASYELLDPDSKFRATIINVGKNWTKSSQASLLSGSSTTHLSEPQLDSEKYAAFDLLDALTKSGALPIEHASLHVVIAGTQCFDQSLMDAVVCRNINPIDRVERSTLIMASTLYNEPVRELIHVDQVQRVGALSPMLFIEE